MKPILKILIIGHTIGRLQDKGILPFSGGVIVSSFAPLPALFWLSGTHMKEKKSD